MFSPSEMQPMASSFFSAYASLAASMMLIRSLTNDLIPKPLRSYLQSSLHYLFKPLFPQVITIVVDERAGISRNEVYEAAEIYLRTKISPATERFKVNKTARQKKINTCVEKNGEVVDTFQNIELNWKFLAVESSEKNYSKEKTFFELRFNKRFKETVVEEYLPFVLAKSKEIKENDKVVKLYSRDCSSKDDDGGSSSVWGSVNLEHPSTFDTLAMDPDMKKAIIDDLDRFVRRKDFYKKVGKAWKRGYLLYGPPGTGKSSLIAAMANYLHFDIYDLELTSVRSNSKLRNVLLSTTNRSIVVIEDIDCSEQLKTRKSGHGADNSTPNLTLSGLLNFIDGLWSSCGDERIIVFTTNHKDRLDPALLRPGRMDLHIHMSYCTYDGFKLLASNYLGLKNHGLFGEVQEVMENVQVTPAEVAEQLMKSEDADVALNGVLSFLKDKEMDLAGIIVKDDEKNPIVEANISAGSSITNAKGRTNKGAELLQFKVVKKANGIEKRALRFFRKITRGKGEGT